MLEILGTIGANILSLPGILGLAVGMMTRNLLLAAALGVLIGVAETLIFVGFQVAEIETMELLIAIAVGLLAGTIGSLFRIKGTTAQHA